MSYTDKAEVTREYYRKQGEQRERERIFAIIGELLERWPLMPASALEVALREELNAANKRPSQL